MTLTELRYIVAVAQERHFGRAAQRCHVSQPTLSIAIKKLEEELALSLFDRSSNEVITTEAGGRIVAQARRVLDEADVIRQLASEEQNELDGAFKLGLIFTVAPYLLPKLILSLREIAPNMPLMLEENLHPHADRIAQARRFGRHHRCRAISGNRPSDRAAV